MRVILRTLSRRDTLLILLGAFSMHIFSSFFAASFDRSSIVINTHIPHPQFHHPPNLDPLPPPPEPPVTTHPDAEKPATTISIPQSTSESPIPLQPQVPVDQARSLPETTLVAHAPGWTIFRNLYMADGTFYIVTRQTSSFPEVRKMISVAMHAEASPENIAAREPTREEIDFLTPEHAKRLWGGDIDRGQRNRVWSIQGSTFLCNDPDQFLDHYYHFVAELLFGAWALWAGTFSSAVSPTSPSLHNPSSLQTPFIPHNSPFNSSVHEPLHRIIFAHSTADGWRDNPGFNAYVLRAAFPSLTVEVENDWLDRVYVTPKFRPGSGTRSNARAWHFPLILIADRSASFRGEACGSRTQRTAAEAVEAMVAKGLHRIGWWEPIRRAVVQFAGGDPNAGGTVLEAPTRVEDKNANALRRENKPVEGTSNNNEQQQQLLPMPSKIVLTYIVRQGTRRRLTDEDHASLVDALEEMSGRHGWELNVVQAEHLSKDEQVRIMSRTTIMLGVHGNGLTHLVMMPPTRVSAVIEIFIPGGFAHDYQWTTHALGMRHFAVWNDTYRTLPDKPDVEYPEGFQGSEIPVYAPTIVQLIEDRLDGKL